MPAPNTYDIKRTPKPVPEKPYSWVLKLLPWVFILVGIAAIAWMVYTNPPQKALNCSNNNGQSSLLEFGTCTEE